MNKVVLHLAFFCALALACTPAAAGPQPVATSGNAVDQCTGELWVQSTKNEKLAFLLGVETAITVEHFVNGKVTERAAKQGKKPVYTLSPFEKAWMRAFKDMPRHKIADLVDAYYAAHPDQLRRSVMDVIWHEGIEPRLSHTQN